MAVDFPAPEKPGITTRSRSASSFSSEAIDLLVSVPYHPETPYQGVSQALRILSLTASDSRLVKFAVQFPGQPPRYSRYRLELLARRLEHRVRRPEVRQQRSFA